MKKYGRLFGYLGKNMAMIWAYLACSLLTILFSLVSIGSLPIFLQVIFSKASPAPMQPGHFDFVKYINISIDGYIKQHGSEGRLLALAWICGLLSVTVFFKNLFYFLCFTIASPLKLSVITQLRQALYDKLLDLPISYFTEKRKGDLISRMTNDVSEIELSVVGTLEGFIKEPINLLVILFSLIYLSPSLSLFLVVFLPITGFIVGRVSRSLKKHSAATGEKLGIALSILEETLVGIRVIKAFNAESFLREKFKVNNWELFKVRNKVQIKGDLASPLNEVLGVLILVAILWFGGRLVLSGEGLEASGFIMYIGFFTQIISPAKSITNQFYNIKKGSAAIDRIEEILREDVKVDVNEKGNLWKGFEDCIEFDNVGFAYEDTPVLENINIKIKKGTTVALVGSSGSGKSTLADLLPRFHDVTNGEIRIDGIPIKEYSLYSVRSQMGIVTQEPILFNDTIFNNIVLGKPDATIEEVEKAAKAANAYNFIVQKEKGFLTNIGDRGNKLSGGEKQRLTIARALLRNPPLLILDEATSSLDTESEKLVQDAIQNMMINRTSLVIAHRLSTIRQAHEIIVLQKGKIAERGTHEQLMQLGGIYRRLVDMQEVNSIRG